ncbi:hypothetical protein IT417_03060 [bacterium]|nr:hypothetical protein [bacterium]
MQPTDLQNNNEVKGPPQAEWLRETPAELVNIVPATVWSTLTVDQKQEMLRQHGIYEKYVKEVRVEEATPSVEVAPVTSTKPEVIVQQEQKVEKNEEFEIALNVLKEEKKNSENFAKPVMPAEEVARVEAEQAKTANVKTYNFFGYQPTTTTYTNAKSISNDAPVSDAKTWAATLIAKIFSLFE